jgi:hypothetical protein
MTNPLDDFLATRPKTAAASLPNRGMKKQALGNPFAGMGGQAKDTLLRAGATGLVGAAGAGLGAAVQHLYDAATKSRDFRTMLDHNPDLHEQLQQNPKMFNQAFSTLRTMNPMFSRDPLIAGTYMRQMMDSPLTAGGKAVEALSHRQPASSILDMFAKGTMEGAKAGLRPQPGGRRPMEQESVEDNTPFNI